MKRSLLLLSYIPTDASVDKDADTEEGGKEDHQFFLINNFMAALNWGSTRTKKIMMLLEEQYQEVRRFDNIWTLPLSIYIHEMSFIPIFIFFEKLEKNRDSH